VKVVDTVCARCKQQLHIVIRVGLRNCFQSSSNNKIDPEIVIFPDPRRVVSKHELVNQDAPCFKDEDEEKQQGESRVHPLAVVGREQGFT